MRLLLIAVLTISAAGCSSTRTLTPGSLDGDEINQALTGKTAEVTLTNGATVSALSIAVRADTTTWIEPDTREFVRVPTLEVASVTRRSRGRGFLQGALITGLTAAVVVGTYAVLDTGDWGPYEDAKPALGFVVGAVSFLPGAVPGGVVGYARGAERRYEVAPAASSADTARSGVAADSVLISRHPRR